MKPCGTCYPALRRATEKHQNKLTGRCRSLRCFSRFRRACLLGCITYTCCLAGHLHTSSTKVTGFCVLNSRPATGLVFGTKVKLNCVHGRRRLAESSCPETLIRTSTSTGQVNEPKINHQWTMVQGACTYCNHLRKGSRSATTTVTGFVVTAYFVEALEHLIEKLSCAQVFLSLLLMPVSDAGF
jgi:hypothetical protein